MRISFTLRFPCHSKKAPGSALRKSPWGYYISVLALLHLLLLLDARFSKLFTRISVMRIPAFTWVSFKSCCCFYCACISYLSIQYKKSWTNICCIAVLVPTKGIVFWVHCCKMLAESNLSTLSISRETKTDQNQYHWTTIVCQYSFDGHRSIEMLCLINQSAKRLWDNYMNK